MTHDLVIVGAGPVDKRVDAVYKGFPPISEARITIPDGTKQQTLDFLGETIQRWKLNVHYGEGVRSIRKDEETGLFDVTTPA